MKTDITYYIRWIIINGLFAFTLYLAVTGNLYASNILIFCVWVLAILTALSYASKLKMVREGKEIRNPDGAVDKWVDRIYDFSFLMTLIAFGWFITAFAYGMHWYFLEGWRHIHENPSHYQENNN